MKLPWEPQSRDHKRFMVLAERSNASEKLQDVRAHSNRVEAVQRDRVLPSL